VAALPAATAAPRESFRDDWRSAQPQPIELPDYLANTAGAAEALRRRLGDPGLAVVRAARWHDLGKAHAIFQATMAAYDRMPQGDARLWAKSRCQGARHTRPYFRHELASALAWRRPTMARPMPT
jgi:CRISPR-associated endonuclease/helicase Cas3